MKAAEARERPDERVLVLAPRGRNADMIADALRRASFGVMICLDPIVGQAWHFRLLARLRPEDVARSAILS